TLASGEPSIPRARHRFAILPTRLAPWETAPATSPRATAPAKGRGPSAGGAPRSLVVGGLRGGRSVALGRGDPGDVLGDVAGERLRGQPDVGEDLGARGVVEELLRDAERADRDVDLGVAQEAGDGVAHGAGAAVVLGDGDQGVLAGEVEQRRVERLHPPRVDDRDPDALR